MNTILFVWNKSIIAEIWLNAKKPTKEWFNVKKLINENENGSNQEKKLDIKNLVLSNL